MKIQSLLPGMTLLLAMSAPAMAQYQGPGAVAPRVPPAAAAPVASVASIKADPKDDAKVVLEGRLIRQLSAERYVFADASGEIEVEIDDDDFPPVAVSDTTMLRIEGEVDTHRSRDADIDVDRVTLLQ